MYNELTSKVTSKAFGSIGPSWHILDIKCCVSLICDMVVGAYPLMCSSTNLLMFHVGWLHIGCPGMPFL